MKHLGKKTTAATATILTVFSLNANKASDKINIDLEVLNMQGVEITIHATTVEQTNDATFTGFNDAVSQNKKEDPQAVRKGGAAEAEKLSKHAVRSNGQKGMMVFDLLGSKEMEQEMIAAGKRLHAVYEDSNRENNTDVAILYDFDERMGDKIAGSIEMNGDEFKLKSGRTAFTPEQLEHYADNILKYYKKKYGSLPATPTTPKSSL